MTTPLGLHVGGLLLEMRQEVRKLVAIEKPLADAR
jgi:hypothetical protein